MTSLVHICLYQFTNMKSENLLLSPFQNFLHDAWFYVISARLIASRLCTCTTTGLLGTSLSQQHFVMLIGVCPTLLSHFYFFLLIFANYFFCVLFLNLTNALTCLGSIFLATFSSYTFLVRLWQTGLLFLSIMWAVIGLMLDPSLFHCSHNRKACWGRGRKLCFVAFLHSYWCWSKPCFVVGFTKKYSLCWSFWCCFWVIYYQCPCEGTRNFILTSMFLCFQLFFLGLRILL